MRKIYVLVCPFHTSKVDALQPSFYLCGGELDIYEKRGQATSTNETEKCKSLHFCGSASTSVSGEHCHEST
jgi:hypothetical protein